ncbi:MAG: hypothetical protein KAU99_02340 [Thermoplasmata archaeon]|nr:hypothetical protein [Thermoplasmata archaeon]
MNIGVFVCGCSGNISNYIDTGKVAKEAETLDDVSFVDNQAHALRRTPQGHRHRYPARRLLREAQGRNSRQAFSRRGALARLKE